MNKNQTFHNSLPAQDGSAFLDDVIDLHKTVANDPPAEEEPVSIKPKRKSPAIPWKKVKGFPKRPLSAYNLFFRDERKRLLELSPTKIGFANLAKTVASHWKTLDDHAKAPYDTIATEEKKKYNVAVAAWRAQKRATKLMEQQETVKQQQTKQADEKEHQERAKTTSRTPSSEQSVDSCPDDADPDKWFPSTLLDDPNKRNDPPMDEWEDSGPYSSTGAHETRHAPRQTGYPPPGSFRRAWSTPAVRSTNDAEDYCYSHEWMNGLHTMRSSPEMMIPSSGSDLRRGLFFDKPVSGGSWLRDDRCNPYYNHEEYNTHSPPSSDEPYIATWDYHQGASWYLHDGHQQRHGMHAMPSHHGWYNGKPYHASQVSLPVSSSGCTMNVVYQPNASLETGSTCSYQQQHPLAASYMVPTSHHLMLSKHHTREDDDDKNDEESSSLFVGCGLDSPTDTIDDDGEDASNCVAI